MSLFYIPQSMHVSVSRAADGGESVGLQVVDERMWGDDDKPEPDQKPGEEQRGKDEPAEVGV